MEQNLGKRDDYEAKNPITDPGTVKKVTHLWETLDLSSDSNTKWNYLEHHGVVFPKPFKYAGITVSHNGTKFKLTPDQEEIATYWIHAEGSEYQTHPIYLKNVGSLFESTFEEDVEFSSFDFKPLKLHIAKNKEIHKAKLAEKKEWSKAKKDQVKLEKEERDNFYGYAMVDKRIERMGGYVIEPPTLFRGRGEHPKNGFLKPRTYPEDVTLNLSHDAPVPKCDIPGRAWKDIVENKDVTWLAFSKDEAINSSFKYIFLSSNSQFKSISDIKKFEKARKLKKRIHSIREDY